MQINGIGSSHSSEMHQVTNCMHDHGVTEKKSSGPMSSQSQTANEQRLLQQKLENNFSLNDWVKNILGGARSLWGKIWGTSDIAVQNPNMEKLAETGKEQLITPLSSETDALKEPGLSQASAAVQPMQPLTNNPYFSAIEDTGQQQQTLWQKTRVKFQNIAGYLTKHFSFHNKNDFYTKQQKPKEDLSRRSRYRKDDLEIDCVLTDESYLMDSYNKKGEYSTLSAGNNTKS